MYIIQSSGIEKKMKFTLFKQIERDVWCFNIISKLSEANWFQPTLNENFSNRFPFHFSLDTFFWSHDGSVYHILYFHHISDDDHLSKIRLNEIVITVKYSEKLRFSWRTWFFSCVFSTSLFSRTKLNNSLIFHRHTKRHLALVQPISPLKQLHQKNGTKEKSQINLVSVFLWRNLMWLICNWSSDSKKRARIQWGQTLSIFFITVPSYWSI